MADDVAITAGAGTSVATDDISTTSTARHAQVVKISTGPDGVDAGMVAINAPMPVRAQCVEDCLAQILIEIKTQNVLLAEGLNVRSGQVEEIRSIFEESRSF